MELEALLLPLRQPLAAAVAAAAPADLDPRRRVDRDLGLVPRKELPVRLSFVRWIQAGPDGDGGLLGGKAEELGVEPNPYHAGFLQLVAVGESKARSPSNSVRDGEYFYNKMLHVYPGFVRRLATGPRHDPHGAAGADNQLRRPPAVSCAGRTCWTRATSSPGTPSQVVEQLEHVIKTLHVGHLMVLNQFGSIPHDLATQNIRMLGERVLPKLRHLWDGEWEDHWWIKPSPVRRQPPRLLADSELAAAAR